MKIKPTQHSGEVVMAVNRRDEPLLSPARTSPFRVKKILVPTDFSDCSKKALQYALPLAKEHDAAITLLNVVPTPCYPADGYGGIDYASLEADMRASGDKELRALARSEVRGEVPVDTLVRDGSAATEITEIARSLPADLIIISTHGRTGLKHVFLGSVTEHIVRHAPCPVLVVREREHEFLAS